eukprot:scaffold35385_cov57-Phaeocystis_antarctica.AAC.2
MYAGYAGAVSRGGGYMRTGTTRPKFRWRMHRVQRDCTESHGARDRNPIGRVPRIAVKTHTARCRKRVEYRTRCILVVSCAPVEVTVWV